jgi:hypothetical protein
MSEQEMEITIDPAATEGTVASGAAGAPATSVQPSDDALKELLRQHEEFRARDVVRDRDLETARRDAENARLAAQNAALEAEQAKTQVVSTELQAAIDKLAAAKSEADAAEREYVTAQEAGNWAEAAKAQRRLSRAEANQVAFEREKAYLENQRTVTVTEGRVEQRQQSQPQPAVTDSFEATISRATPRSKEWLRAHPECVTDDEMRMKAWASHAAAVKKGLRPDSDEYFHFVEEYLGFADGENKQQHQTNGQDRGRQRTMPAAPPSREPSSSPTATSLKVKLSPGEVAHATDGTIVWNTGPNKGKPIGVQEMARRKAMLEKEGAYTRRLPQ